MFICHKKSFTGSCADVYDNNREAVFSAEKRGNGFTEISICYSGGVMKA